MWLLIVWLSIVRLFILWRCIPWLFIVWLLVLWLFILRMWLFILRMWLFPNVVFRLLVECGRTVQQPHEILEGLHIAGRPVVGGWVDVIVTAG